MIKVEKFVVNPLGENSFVLIDEKTKKCVLIDPGFYYGEEQDEVKAYIERNGLKPVKIINTHCHFDHIMGVDFIRGGIQNSVFGTCLRCFLDRKGCRSG